MIEELTNYVRYSWASLEYIQIGEIAIKFLRIQEMKTQIDEWNRKNKSPYLTPGTMKDM